AVWEARAPRLYPAIREFSEARRTPARIRRGCESTRRTEVSMCQVLPTQASSALPPEITLQNFNEVVQRFHKRLVRFLCLLTGDWDLAEDLAQSIWTAAYAKVSSGLPVGHDPSRGTVWTWLRWKARSKASQAHRSRVH